MAEFHPYRRVPTMRTASPLAFLIGLWFCLPGCGCHPPNPAVPKAEPTVEESTAEASPEGQSSEPESSEPERLATDEPPAESSEPESSEPESSVSESSEPEILATGEPPAESSDSDAWRDLFDGETLAGWEITKFGGEGEVYVEDGVIQLGFGQPLTGITYQGGDLPKNNYEIQLEAKRVDGFDFFCALTFPVEDSHCSLVVGGWGGSVVGISSIDEMDASENETTEYMTFTNDQWYTIRVRVTPGALEAWIDDKRMVNADVAGRRLSTRIEVDLSQPLGICSFDTQAALRNLRIRELKDE